MPAAAQRARSLEEAEVRKVEAETAEIEARTEVLRVRVLLLWSALFVPWILLGLALLVEPGYLGHVGSPLSPIWLSSLPKP